METLWYYASGNERKGPVTEATLLGLVLDGTVKASDLVWSEGMADWIPFSASALASKVQQPAATAAPASAFNAAPSPLPVSPYARQPEQQPQVPLSKIPEGISGWMKFNGVMLIIQGAFYCLGCIYIIIGVPLIIAGVACFGAADTLENMGGVSSGTVPFLQKLKTMNLWFGIYHIVLLVVMVLAIIMMIFFWAAFMTMIQTAVSGAGGAIP